uniref:Uncharacterized protein n=1 Tax=Acrobeloides nanus TaxID=290746 RepID=A0A914CHL6_9BILA
MPVQEVLTVDGLHDIEKAEPNRQYKRGSILYDHHAHYDDSQIANNQTHSFMSMSTYMWIILVLVIIIIIGVAGFL